MIVALCRIHEYYAQGSALADGYAPFCKHIFVPNFVGAKVRVIKHRSDCRAVVVLLRR